MQIESMSENCWVNKFWLAYFVINGHGYSDFDNKGKVYEKQ